MAHGPCQPCFNSAPTRTAGGVAHRYVLYPESNPNICLNRYHLSCSRHAHECASNVPQFVPHQPTHIPKPSQQKKKTSSSRNWSFDLWWALQDLNLWPLPCQRQFSYPSVTLLRSPSGSLGLRGLSLIRVGIAKIPSKIPSFEKRRLRGPSRHYSIQHTKEQRHEDTTRMERP